MCVRMCLPTHAHVHMCVCARACVWCADARSLTRMCVGACSPWEGGRWLGTNGQVPAGDQKPLRWVTQLGSDGCPGTRSVRVRKAKPSAQALLPLQPLASGRSCSAASSAYNSSSTKRHTHIYTRTHTHAHTQGHARARANSRRPAVVTRLGAAAARTTSIAAGGWGAAATPLQAGHTLSHNPVLRGRSINNHRG
jgi:hypothetical protein